MQHDNSMFYGIGIEAFLKLAREHEVTITACNDVITIEDKYGGVVILHV